MPRPQISTIIAAAAQAGMSVIVDMEKGKIFLEPKGQKPKQPNEEITL